VRLRAVLTVVVLAVACGPADVPNLPPDPRSVQPVPLSAQRPVQRAVPPPRRWKLEPLQTLTPERTDLLQALNAARSAWRATAPNEYRLVVSKKCFCDAGVPFESRVRSKVVVFGAGGVRSWGQPVEPELRKVEMLFAEADRLIRSDAEGVTVRFAPRLGYPARISVDRWRDGQDDEWTWIAVLTVLE